MGGVNSQSGKLTKILTEYLRRQALSSGQWHKAIPDKRHSFLAFGIVEHLCYTQQCRQQQTCDVF